jgi:hypothetical protein
LPCKHIDICLKEGDERDFLFITHIPRDAGGLGGIRANLNDPLQRFTMGRMLGLGKVVVVP